MRKNWLRIVVVIVVLSMITSSVFAIDNPKEVSKNEGTASDVSTTEEVKLEEPMKKEAKAKETVEPLVMLASASDRGNDSMALEVSLIPDEKNSDGTEKLLYYSNKDIVIYNSISISGKDAVLTEPYALITIPKEHISSNPTSSPAAGITNYEITGDADNWYIKYNYPRLVGGQNIEIPFSFKHDNFTTPEGFTTEVKQEVFTKDGTLLKRSEKTFTTKVQEHTTYKYSHGAVVAGPASPSDATVVDSNDALSIRWNIYTRNFEGSNSYGASNLPIKVFDKLPEGAVFDAANPLNADWTYDMATHTAWRIVTPKDGNHAYYSIYVKFPGEKFGTKYTNNVYSYRQDANGNYPDAIDPSTGKHSSGTLYIVESPRLEVQKSTYQNIYLLLSDRDKGKPVKWKITLKSDLAPSPSVFLKNIEDQLQSNMMELTAVKLTAPTDMVGKVSFYGIKENGTEEKINNASANTEIDLSTANYKNLRVDFEDPIEFTTIEDMKKVYVEVTGKYKDENWEDGSVVSSHKNFGKISFFTNGSNKLITRSNYAYSYVRKPNPTFGFSGTANPNIRYMDQESMIRANYTRYNWWVGDEVIKNPKYISILPEGVDYKKGSARYRGSLVNAVVVENYNGTGRKAVVYQHVGEVPGSQSSGFQFKVIFTREAEEGDNQFPTYITMDNMDDYGILGHDYYSSEDTYDINRNGDTKERVLGKTLIIKFIPPKELIGTKRIINSEDNFVTTSDGLDLGGTTKYRFQLNNNTLKALDSITAIDVLSSVGDMSIVPNEDGDYLDRGSEFPITLNGPITPPDGYSVYYSTENPKQDAGEIANQTWVDSLGDYSEAKMFKIVNKPGTTLPSGGMIEFFVDGVVSNDENIEEGAKAFNSFAYSPNGKNFLEANSVVAPVVKYHITGKTFFDMNRDGNQEGEDYGLSGYKVTATNTDTGETYTKTTDSEGKYEFVMLKRGTYKISVEPKTNDLFTIKGNEDLPFANSVDAKGDSAEFRLDIENNKKEVNAGLYKNYGILNIHKVGETNNALEGVEFQLKEGNTVVATLTTDNQGNASYNQLELGTNYILVETKTLKEYALPNDVHNIATTALEPIINLDIKNPLKRGSVKVTKVDKDDENVVLSGITFSLAKKDGTGTPVIGVTQGDGTYTFSNVLYGTYILKETTTLENYVLTETSFEVSITENGQVVGQKVTNELKKGTITITKVDEDDPAKLLEGVTFQLAPKNGIGDPIESVTNNSGKATFANVVYGEYILTEKKTLKNYVKSDEEEEITINTDGQVHETTWTNKKIRGAVEVKKVDADNPDQSLEGVKFQLARKNGIGTPMEGVTDKEGLVLFDNLEYGEYTLSEKETIEGYQRTEETFGIIIEKDGQVVKKTVKNKALPKVLPSSIVNTGDDSKMMGTILLFLSTFVVITVILRRRKTSN